jgi:hypothetical protein
MLRNAASKAIWNNEKVIYSRVLPPYGRPRTEEENTLSSGVPNRLTDITVKWYHTSLFALVTLL